MVGAEVKSKVHDRVSRSFAITFELSAAGGDSIRSGREDKSEE